MKEEPQFEPRVFDSDNAGRYTNRSTSSIRNLRYEDMEREKEGKPPKGPRWVMQGRNVRYYREDLDAWLDSFKEQGNTAWDYNFQSNTTHLKNQNCIDKAEVDSCEASNTGD